MTATRTTNRTRTIVLLALLVLAALATALVLIFRPGTAVDAEPGETPASAATPTPAPATPDPGSPEPPSPEHDPAAVPRTAPESPPAGGRGSGAPGAAEPGTGTPGTPSGPASPEHGPGPDVSLRWDGTAGGGLTVDGSYWGEVTVVPGDSGARTVSVRNDGPTGGTLTASIVNAAAFRDRDDPRWVDDSFYEDLTVNGISASALEGNRTVVHEVHLARGATTEIPLSFAFDGWSGNRTGGGLHPSGVVVNPDGVGERWFSFDVDLRIAGDTTAGPDGPQQPGTDAAHDANGRVIESGGAVLPGDRAWLLLVAAALTVLAGAGARALRRDEAAPADPESPR